MRLTASCAIMVRNVGRVGGSVAVEITQGMAAGEEVTTLLLCPDRARELASALLRHSGDARAEGPGEKPRADPKQEPARSAFTETAGRRAGPGTAPPPLRDGAA